MNTTQVSIHYIHFTQFVTNLRHCQNNAQNITLHHTALMLSIAWSSTAVIL